MKNKKAYTQEIEDEGYPPISNMNEYRALRDLLKSLKSEELGDPVEKLETGPVILPSRLFQITNLVEYLRKIAASSYYIQEGTGDLVFSDDLGIDPDSDHPDTFVQDGVTYTKVKQPEEKSVEYPLAPSETGLVTQPKEPEIMDPASPTQLDYNPDTEIIDVTPEPSESQPENPETKPENEKTPSGDDGENKQTGVDKKDESKDDKKEEPKDPESVREDIKIRFEEIEKIYDFMQSDARFDAPDVFDDTTADNWITMFDRVDLEMEKLPKIENEELNQLDSDTHLLLTVGKKAKDNVNKLSFDVPPGLDVYMLDDEYLATTPPGWKAIPIAETTTEYKGEPVISLHLLTDDGQNIVLLKNSLSNLREMGGGKYFIPMDTVAYMVDTGEVVRTQANIEGVVSKIFSSRPEAYGLPEAKEGVNCRLVDFQDGYGTVWRVKYDDLKETRLVASLKLRALETTEDRPPHAWRDYPESGDFTISKSPVDHDVPYSDPPQIGAVPFLSMPNVGDVMGDRTTTQGHSGDPEYLGKKDQELAEEREIVDIKTKMRNQYKSDLDSAISDRKNKALVDHFREMVRRYENETE